MDCEADECVYICKMHWPITWYKMIYHMRILAHKNDNIYKKKESDI